MRLLWVEARDFRNHRETRVEVPAGLVAAVGPNAQGKTNLLEAAHYLLTLRSPRVASDQPLVRAGAEVAYLRGEVATEGGRVLVEVEVRSSGANRVEVNRSAVRRKRDLRARVRSVMFLPEDLAVIQGEPEDRRRFMDEAAFTLWPNEEGVRAAYDRALRQRNRLLKEHEGPEPPPDLEAWDAEVARHGGALTAARGRAVDRVGPRAGDEFERVAEDRLRVEYAASVEGGPDEDLEAAMLRRLGSDGRTSWSAGPRWWDRTGTSSTLPSAPWPRGGSPPTVSRGREPCASGWASGARSGPTSGSPRSSSSTIRSLVSIRSGVVASAKASPNGARS